jgi:hypothetical protein
MNRILRASVASLLVSTAWAQDSASTGQNPTTESGWSAMKECAAILDDDLRHACTDNVLRDAGLLPGSETASTKRQQRFGLQRPAARAAPSPSDAPAQPKSEDKLEVTLAAVKESHDGKLVLTTTDGAIWKQVETQVVQPTPVQGGSMTITKTIFGGFMCKPNKWTTFRCSRTR